MDWLAQLLVHLIREVLLRIDQDGIKALNPRSTHSYQAIGDNSLLVFRQL